MGHYLPCLSQKFLNRKVMKRYHIYQKERSPDVDDPSNSYLRQIKTLWYISKFQILAYTLNVDEPLLQLPGFKSYNS